MNLSFRLYRLSCVRMSALICLLLFSPQSGNAQTPPPWTGVINNDAGTINARGMSADARFVAFDAPNPLLEDDLNGVGDVYLRDRRTGNLQRISIATDGSESDGHSDGSAISADGRHLVFRSFASNLDSTDVNGVADIYVRDLLTGVTSLVTIGPAGQRLGATFSQLPNARLSADGRFVLFNADFRIAGDWLLWLRDRDGDEDGVFDEPGTVSTTGINLSKVGDDRVDSIDVVAISNDARYIAISGYDSSETSIGYRIYLHDRVFGTSFRVDRPLAGSADVVAFSRAPDFSDHGELAYVSSVPNLVAGDVDASADVFVYNIATASNVRLTLTHIDAILADGYGTAISADGRFVAFTGYEIDGFGTQRWNVYAIDRLQQASYDVSVRIDGARDDEAIGAAISADGGAIAFNGGTRIIHESLSGAFVATSVSVTSSVTEVPTAGGFVPVEINVPADTFWTALLITGGVDDYITHETYTGVGPETIDVEIPLNQSGEATTYHLWLGSEDLVFTQAVTPILYWLGPTEGPAAAGTPFQITGYNFKDGATVTFDGVPATDIVIEEDGMVLYGVTPPHLAGDVLVVVTNPDGGSSGDEMWFSYYDQTPPVVIANVTGTIGANGWYTSNVSVQWAIEEFESEISETICEDVTQTTDIALRTVHCFATSAGGDTTQQVAIKRDATAPSIAISQPQAQTYAQGEIVEVAFSCADATSGIASCAANQTGNLNTSMPGTFAFVVNAVDEAGNTSQLSVAYAVKAAKSQTSMTLSSSPNPSRPNQDIHLTATVAALAPDAALPTGVVELRIDGTLVGSAPLVNGVATGTVKFKKGSYVLTATYLGDENSNGSTATTIHTTR